MELLKIKCPPVGAILQIIWSLLKVLGACTGIFAVICLIVYLVRTFLHL